MSAPADTSLSVSAATRGKRVLALDALRGLAVAGIAWMNVIAYAMPSAAYVNPRAYGGTGLGDVVAWVMVFVTVEDKFRALFAIMFGAGVAILLARPVAHPLRDHCARMAVLFAIGWLHALLLASNDILRVYAIAGLVLPLAVRWRTRRLVWGAVGLIAAQLAVAAWAYRDLTATWFALSSQPLPHLQFDPLFGLDPDSIAAALQRDAESLGQRIARRVAAEPDLTIRILAGLPSSLAAMLIGVALWRGGLLRGQWSRAELMRLFRRTAIPALVVLAAMAGFIIASGFDAYAAFSISYLWSAPFDILLAAGWAALAMALFAGGGRMTELFASVGRMALTNYVFTSLVFSALFASWGLGLTGQLDRVEAYLMCVIPIALMLAISPLWLSRFRQGPLEWLWRSLAQWQRLPLTK